MKSDVKTDISRDIFHKGNLIHAFEVVQFANQGHRAGMDAMLLAASLPDDSYGIVADLGAASGAAGLAALNMHKNLTAVLVEFNKDLVELAHQTLRLSANSHFINRVNIINADVTLSGEKRSAAGLKSNSVNHVILNPPYNQPNLRASPDPMRADAHVMAEGGLDAWLRTASAILKPGGCMSLIYRSERLGEILACSQGRFGDLSIFPIFSRKGEAAKRIIVRGIAGSKGPMHLMPGLIMHDDDGKHSAEAVEILNGNRTLNFV